MAPKFLRLSLAIGLASVAPFLGAGVGRLDNFSQRVLASHNRERIAVGVPALKWDEGLARAARAWGGALSSAETLQHESGDDEGENLWAGTTGNYGVESMVGMWIAEKSNYKAGIFPANSRTGRLEDVGHYTQLMWRDTRKVGCAVVGGRSEEYMVCRYSNGGNVIGERPF